MAYNLLWVLLGIVTFLPLDPLWAKLQANYFQQDAKKLSKNDNGNHQKAALLHVKGRSHPMTPTHVRFVTEVPVTHTPHIAIIYELSI